MDTRTVPAGEFKAKCLALLDEVADTGEEIVVTKRGKPVARLAPVRAATRKKTYRRPSLAHMVEWIGDIESASSGEWETLPRTQDPNT